MFSLAVYIIVTHKILLRIVIIYYLFTESLINKSLNYFLIQIYLLDKSMIAQNQSVMVSGIRDLREHEERSDIVIMQYLHEMKMDQKEMNQSIKEIKSNVLIIKQDVLELKILNEKVIKQIKNTENILRRSLFEVDEVKIPSCFIIVNQKLQPISKLHRTSVDDEKVRKSIKYSSYYFIQ